MARYRVFPDAEAVVSIALRTAPLISGLDSRVYSSVPKDPTYPLCTVKRIGGIPRERHALDRAEIQVDVWGNGKGGAADVAALARVKIHELEGTTLTHADLPNPVFITAVQDTLGLMWLPDVETARDRYIFGVTLYLHGDPVPSQSLTASLLSVDPTIPTV